MSEAVASGGDTPHGALPASLSDGLARVVGGAIATWGRASRNITATVPHSEQGPHQTVGADEEGSHAVVAVVRYGTCLSRQQGLYRPDSSRGDDSSSMCTATAGGRPSQHGVTPAATQHIERNEASEVMPVPVMFRDATAALRTRGVLPREAAVPTTCVAIECSRGAGVNLGDVFCEEDGSDEVTPASAKVDLVVKSAEADEAVITNSTKASAVDVHIDPTYRLVCVINCGDHALLLERVDKVALAGPPQRVTLARGEATVVGRSGWRCSSCLVSRMLGDIHVANYVNVVLSLLCHIE